MKNKYMVNSPEYGIVIWIYVAATIIGAVADWVLVSNTFYHANIGEGVAGLFQGQSDDFVRKVGISTSFILGLVICFLGIAFMFKAGSLFIENKKVQYIVFIVVWVFLGIGLFCFRLFTETFDKETGKMTENWRMQFILAALLFIMYIGSGISGFFVGNLFGNTLLDKYKKLDKALGKDLRIQLQNSYDSLIESMTECNKLSIKAQKTMDNLLFMYDGIDSLIDNEIVKMKIIYKTNQKTNIVHRADKPIIEGEK